MILNKTITVDKSELIALIKKYAAAQINAIYEQSTSIREDCEEVDREVSELLKKFGLTEEDIP